MLPSAQVNPRKYIPHHFPSKMYCFDKSHSTGVGSASMGAVSFGCFFFLQYMATVSWMSFPGTFETDNKHGLWTSPLGFRTSSKCLSMRFRRRQKFCCCHCFCLSQHEVLFSMHNAVKVCPMDGSQSQPLA